MGKISNPWFKKSILLVAALVVAAGIIIVFSLALKNIPSASGQLAENSQSLQVLIPAPLDGTQWPADAFIPVSAVVIGNNRIVQMELWVDGRLFKALSPDVMADPLWTTGSWKWMPGSIGAHSLFVRVEDSAGQKASSPVVRIQAGPAAGFGWYDSYTDESVGDVFSQLTPPSLPDERSDGINSLPPLSPPSAQPEAPSGFSFWIERTFFATYKLPAAPQLAASSAGCDVTLAITDKASDESGFFIYRSQPGSASFQRITSLPANNGSSVIQYLDADQRGPVLYNVAAFNAAGESAGDPVRSQDVHGDWSAIAMVTISIVQEPSLTPSATLEISPTPTVSQTPTLTPTPTQAAALSFGQPQVSTHVFEYQRDCVPDPDQVTLQVTLSNAPQGSFAFFFFRLKKLNDNSFTSWNSGLAMNALGNGVYSFTLKSNMIPEVSTLRGVTAELQYQFVATDGQGGVRLKSPVFSDIQLKKCQ